MSEILKNIINSKLSIKEQNKQIYNFTNYIPVYISKNNNDKNINNISRNKFLIDKHLTFNYILNKIIKKLNLKSTQSIYLYINKKIININDKIINLYEYNKNNDNFLHIEYSSMESFG